MTNLLAAIDAQRAMLAPATTDQIKSACKALVAHAEVAGTKCPEVDSLFAVWSAHCRDMPGHLLAVGLAEVLKRWTNTFCLPSPGAVWEQIGDRLARMRADLSTMEAARWKADDAPEPEERKPSAETDAVIAETMRVLRAAGGGRRMLEHSARKVGDTFDRAPNP